MAVAFTLADRLDVAGSAFDTLVQPGKEWRATIAVIEARAPALVDARIFVDRFDIMIRKKIEVELDPWIADGSLSLITSFAKEINMDKVSVQAAIIEPWSNGRTEGQITKLKSVKRQMYGRAKLDLLQARLIGAA